MELCTSCELGVTVTFPMLRKFSAIISSSIFVALSLFSFWDPYNVNVSVFDVVPDISKLSSFLFFLFSLFCGSDFHHSLPVH